MAAIAAIVFIALYFVEAGYGMLFDKKWGFPIPNKIAWICMEAPVFIVMFLLWNGSEPAVRGSTVPDIFILRTALFPTVFYFSIADKRQKQNAGRHHAYGNHL